MTSSLSTSLPCGKHISIFETLAWNGTTDAKNTASLREDTRADGKETVHLIEGILADYWLADKDCDTQEIIESARTCGMTVVISPKCNRKEQRECDKFFINFVTLWKTHAYL